MKTTQAVHFIQSIDSSWKGHELFAIWIVKQIQPRIIVDLGFDRGLSTIAFAYRNRGHTFGIDWFEDKNYSQKTIAIDHAFQNISTALSLKYIKNLHLIIGPFGEVSQKWNHQIDLLHIDWAHRYIDVKLQYEIWKRHLKRDSVILVHDVEAFSDETGRFFRELPFPRIFFPHSKGLGIATHNIALLRSIAAQWPNCIFL